MQKIVLGGGCFWCTEAVMKKVPGVLKIMPSYSAGHTKNPTYKDICSGTTGHAEVIEVSFDEKQVKLDYLLDIFFEAHDPTTFHQQGADVGSQYRSIILYSDDKQKKEANDAIKRAQKNHANKIVTEVEKLKVFYPAEDYHMDYYKRNPLQPYCMLVIRPKVNKIEKKLKESKI